jgi:GxxExxY protein
MNPEEVFKTILDCAFEVHRHLGPGLLENAYKHCLAYEIMSRGLLVEIEKELPLFYKGTEVSCGYRLDLLIEKEIVVELKSVEHLAEIHLAQILSYLKLSEKKLGLLINFNCKLLVEGIRRVVLSPENER